MRNTEILTYASLAVAFGYFLSILASVDYATALLAAADEEYSLVGVLRRLPTNSIYSDMFSCFSFLATAYSLDAFKSLFKTYKFSHSEDDIMAEGTAKIGLANDGPSLYIDLVDTTLFGGLSKDNKLKEHSRGCECSNCDTKNFEGIRSVVMIVTSVFFSLVFAVIGLPGFLCALIFVGASGYTCWQATPYLNEIVKEVESGFTDDD